MVNAINSSHALSFNYQNYHWMQILPRSSIFGMVAETARKRTWARELDFSSGFWASIFILLTIASKTAPRGSFNRWTSSISRSAISLKKLSPPSFARYRVTASNFYLEKELVTLLLYSFKRMVELRMKHFFIEIIYVEIRWSINVCAYESW